MENSRKYRRRIKLIKPGLQLRMIAAFAGIAILAFMLQGLLLGLLLAETASGMPQGGTHLMASLPRLPIEVFLISCGIFLPLVLSVGVVVTFRIAGPLYRFEQYLKGIETGETVGPCRLRKGDELQDLSEIITRVTEPLRRQPSEAAPQALEAPEAPRGEDLAGEVEPDQEDLREAG